MSHTVSSLHRAIIPRTPSCAAAKRTVQPRASNARVNDIIVPIPRLGMISTFEKSKIISRGCSGTAGNSLACRSSESTADIAVVGALLERALALDEDFESGTVHDPRYAALELGEPANFGVVAPGNRADLVLLNANPLDDLANLADRAGVMVKGHWLPASEIEAGLAALAAKHGA